MSYYYLVYSINSTTVDSLTNK